MPPPLLHCRAANNFYFQLLNCSGTWVELGPTGRWIHDFLQDLVQDLLQDLAQDLLQDLVQDLLQDPTHQGRTLARTRVHALLAS